MLFAELRRFQSYLIFSLLIGLMIFTLWIHGLTAAIIDIPHYLTFSSPDIWYNFRQIELMVHNYPVYSWFDPMTAFPGGKSLDWGPLTPFIAASFSLAMGMTSRPDMMYVVSWIPPIIAALMVPILYFLGKILWDWKTGIAAAVLITLISGIYFINSSFGTVDHHPFEMLFGSAFCLMYLFTLLYCFKNSPDGNNSRVSIIFLSLSLITAIIYFAGFLNMPTMILFALIVAIYSFIQFLYGTLRNSPSKYLLFTNLAVFSPVTIFMLIFGVKQPGFSLQQYSIAPIIAIIFIIGETLVMYILSSRLNQNKIYYFSSVVAFVAIVLISMQMISTATFGELLKIFGQTAEISTITESKPWSLVYAYSSFNFALILAVAGFLLLFYQIYRKGRQEHIFFAIWSVIIFIITLQHLRYEYYFAVNVVLLASLCICIGLETGFIYSGERIRGLFQPVDRPQDTGTCDDKKTPKNKKPGNKTKPNKKISIPSLTHRLKIKQVIGVILIIGISSLTVLTIAISIQNDLDISASPILLIDKNWVETMEWLPAHTPDPGVNYFGDFQQNNYVHPKTAYGILTWWDYGHYITFIGKRIPVTNPFQDNVAGPSGAAAFFLADSENETIRILQSTGARYVITDTSMTTSKFEPLVTWYNSNTVDTDYMKSFFIKDPAKSGQLLQFNGKLPPYFNTTIVRLHNFDGSMQIPKMISYLEYYNENRNGLLYPVVTNVQFLDARFLNKTEVNNAIKNFERQRAPANSDKVLVGQYLFPLGRVPAMQHFRLVYESPGTSEETILFDNSGAENLKQVKVFEFVKGAHIKGEGTIELQVVTNTGRTFTYQQESDKGEFIVPYSTVNNPNEVQANGKYHIIGTNTGIDITEDDIVEGKYVNY